MINIIPRALCSDFRQHYLQQSHNKSHNSGDAGCLRFAEGPSYLELIVHESYENIVNMIEIELLNSFFLRFSYLPSFIFGLLTFLHVLHKYCFIDFRRSFGTPETKLQPGREIRDLAVSYILLLTCSICLVLQQNVMQKTNKTTLL